MSEFPGLDMSPSGILIFPSLNGDCCNGSGKMLGPDGNLLPCCCDGCQYYEYCFTPLEAILEKEF